MVYGINLSSCASLHASQWALSTSPWTLGLEDPGFALRRPYSTKICTLTHNGPLQLIPTSGVLIVSGAQSAGIGGARATLRWKWRQQEAIAVTAWISFAYAAHPGMFANFHAGVVTIDCMLFLFFLFSSASICTCHDWGIILFC